MDGHDTVLEIFNLRLSAIRESRDVLEAERKRIEQIEIVRTERRISAETEARQQNLGVEETEKSEQMKPLLRSKTALRIQMNCWLRKF